MNRRRDKRLGRLSAERIAELDALGMVWDPKEADWDAWIAAASTYREEHGDLRVPYELVANGIGLGNWISIQRKNRRRRTLSEEQIAELDALGMVWDPKEADWDAWIAAASTYREEHGHLRVPHERVGLGNWISIQRKNRRHGTLREEHIAELDVLGMVWDAQNKT